ncbi:hypothetical protein HZC34_01610 [Candidatus Saganbacteria bacterium]|nr:hypothetical protein [Candidatus Saganbacteria bacterium]
MSFFVSRAFPSPRTDLGLPPRITVQNVPARTLIGQLQEHHQYLTVSASNILIQHLISIPAHASLASHELLDALNQTVTFGLNRIAENKTPIPMAIPMADALGLVFIHDSNKYQLATIDEVKSSRRQIEIVDIEYLSAHSPQFGSVVRADSNADKITPFAVLPPSLSWFPNDEFENKERSMQNSLEVGKRRIPDLQQAPLNMCPHISFIGTNELYGVKSGRPFVLGLHDPRSTQAYLDSVEFSQTDPRPVITVFYPVQVPRPEAEINERFSVQGFVRLHNEEARAYGIATYIGGQLQPSQFVLLPSDSSSIQGDDIAPDGKSLPLNIKFDPISAREAAQGTKILRPDSGVVIMAMPLKFAGSEYAYDTAREVQLIRIIFVGIDQTTTQETFSSAIANLNGQ